MKKIILLAACFIATFGSYGQYHTVNAVTPYISAPDTGFSVNAGSCSGNVEANALWHIPSLNFYHSFDLVFYANFTIIPNPIGNMVGADGICAVFGHNINTSSSVNAGGGFIGYYDSVSTYHNPAFINSLGIEYDIFQNPCATSNDPGTGTCGPVYYDHIMIAKNADILTPLGGTPVHADLSASNIKDGHFRKFEIKWSCDKDTIYIYSKDTLRATYGFDPAIQFGSVTNAEQVYWGFTSATGWQCAIDTIKNIKLTMGDSCSAPCFDTSCHPSVMGMIVPGGGCTWQFTVNGICPDPGVLITLYDWDFGDGSGDTYNPLNPVMHTFPAGGPYTVTLKKVVAYNTITGECCELYGPFKFVVVCPPHKAAHESNINTLGKSINVFPNPSNGELNITTTDVSIYSVGIYNSVGQRVVDRRYDNSKSETIDIRMLPDGYYIVEVVDNLSVSHRIPVVLQR